MGGRLSKERVRIPPVDIPARDEDGEDDGSSGTRGFEVGWVEA